MLVRNDFSGFDGFDGFSLKKLIKPIRKTVSSLDPTKKGGLKNTFKGLATIATAPIVAPVAMATKATTHLLAQTGAKPFKKLNTATNKVYKSSYVAGTRDAALTLGVAGAAVAGAVIAAPAIGAGAAAVGSAVSAVGVGGVAEAAALVGGAAGLAGGKKPPSQPPLQVPVEPEVMQPQGGGFLPAAIGGGAGFLLGGPVGAALGVAAGAALGARKR